MIYVKQFDNVIAGDFNFNVENGTDKSNVYFCNLNAAKVFVCINHFYLFSCLIDWGAS